MKRKLTDNLGLKFGSILFAGILWLLVTNINDPPVPQRFYNVPVVIRDTEKITSQGKIYEVLDDSDSIDVVTVTAPRSIIDSIGKENIIAVADMNDLTSLNTIGIKLSTNKYNDDLDDIKASHDSVKLNIEDKESIQLVIKAVTTGKLDSNYIVGDVYPDQNQVRISGPKSVVSQISKAEVNVDITGFTSDLNTNTEIKLYDIEGNEVSKDSLTLSINSVKVNAEILATKEVPIKFAFTGTPANGYRATGIVSSVPDVINLAGKPNSLKNFSTWEIPDTAIDITGMTEDYTTTINVREYLPGNIELADPDFNGDVSVAVYIQAEITRNILMSEDDISIQNLPEGYSGVITTYEEEFTIQVTGLPQDVNNINPEEIKGIVDIAVLLENGTFEEVTEGYYDVSPAFNLPENVSLREKITVRLNIKKRP